MVDTVSTVIEMNSNQSQLLWCEIFTSVFDGLILKIKI